MRLAICAVAVLAVGCATPQQRAARLSSPVLCYINYAGNASDKAATGPELASRRFSCSQQDIQLGMQEYQAMQHQRNIEAQQSLEAARILLTPPPAPPAPAMPIRCHTDRWGNTTCW